MAVSYKPLMHMMIERDISNADKVESICSAMNCTPNDMMEFIPDQPKEEEDHD